MIVVNHSKCKIFFYYNDYTNESVNPRTSAPLTHFHILTHIEMRIVPRFQSQGRLK